MSLITNDLFVSCDSICSQLIQNSEIMFSGFVNNRGRIITSGKSNSFKFHDEKTLEMFVMEIALDFSMKNEFDDVLGKVTYAVTRREHFSVLCIPMDELILVTIVGDCVPIERVVKKIYHSLYKLVKTEAKLHELVR